jgi:hypothetical protein
MDSVEQLPRDDGGHLDRNVEAVDLGDRGGADPDPRRPPQAPLLSWMTEPSSAAACLLPEPVDPF